MINLKHLELQNFLSHVNTSLSLEDYEGLVLIEGINSLGQYSSNGSGKSTLLEGILYALTGDTLRGVSVSDVVNRNYGKNTKVSLDFLRDSVKYTVSRYRKDDNFGDSLIVSRDDENISKRVNKETQKYLDDVLGISYKVLVSTMLLGEGLSSRFTQLSDPEKKNLIESTLNLNYDISAIRTKANTKLSELKLNLSNLEGKISTLKELSTIDVESCKKAIEENTVLAAKASEEIEELRSSLGEIQASRGLVGDKITLINNAITQRNALENELKKLDDEVLIYVNEMNNIENSDAPCCALCHQVLSTSESLESVRENYKEKISSVHKRMLDIQSQLTSMPAMEVLREKYQSLLQELGTIDLSVENKTYLFDEKSKKLWEYKSIAKNYQDELDRYNSNTSDISSLEKEYDLISHDITVYKYFYDLFSPTGIIVNILSDAIEYINTRLSTYSGVLLEKDYKINFVKGKISLVDSKGSSYQSLSAGEKKRLDLSIQFSLHDYIVKYCGISMDTLFIDEVMDALDDVGVENIITVLRMKLDYCNLSRILVISHNSELKSYFDQIVTVKKDEKGDSRIC